MYAVIGLTYILDYLVGANGNTPVTDAAGVVWHTGSITESAAVVSIYTMLFAAALAAVKLLQGSAGLVTHRLTQETDGSARTDR